MNNNNDDNNIKKECSQCGKCCANVLMLSPKEIQIIKNYIKKYNIPIYNHNTIFLKEDSNICPFLHYNDDNTTSCNIYPVRPAICKSFNCNSEYNKIMNYNGVKAINMLFAFGGNDQFSVNPPDLSQVNEHIKKLQRKIKNNTKKSNLSM